MSTQIAAMREQGVPLAAIYIDDRYVVFGNGLTLPINSFYDEDDNEVEDPDDASYFEAGDSEHGFITSSMPATDVEAGLETFH